MFLLHSVIILIEYSKYSTESKVAAYTPLEQVMPRTSLCFPTFSFSKRNLTKSFFEIAPEATLNHQLGEIFKSTPHPDSIIHYCQYRDFDLDIMKFERNVTACNEYFHVRRYRMYGYMCYLFEPNDTKPYMMHSLTYSMDRERQLYRLTLKSPFNRGIRILPLIHFDDLPDDEITFNQEFLPSIDQGEYFILSYSLYETVRLRAPYDTNCGNKSIIICYYDCMDSFYRKEGYISVGSTNVEFETPNDLLIPNYSNKTEARLITHIYRNNTKFCARSCSKLMCHNQLITTFISHSSPSKDKLSLVIETARNPMLKVKYEVKLPFMHTIIQITSVAGIWIGFSMTSMLIIKKSHPFALYVNLVNNLYARARSLEMLTNRRVHRMQNIRSLNLNHNHHNDNHRKRHDLRKVFILKCALLAYKGAILMIFSYQMMNISVSYLAYETQTHIRNDLNPNLDFPSITICIKLSNVLSIIGYNQINNSNYEKELTHLYMYHNLTVKEIMKKSIPSNKTLNGCRIRNYTKHFSEINEISVNSCLDKFDIKKFLLNKKICYMFTPKFQKLRQLQSDHRLVLNNPGIMYSLILNPILSKYSVLSVAVTSGEDYPFISLRYSANSFKRRTNRLHIISNQLQFKKSLPAPYDTRCVEISDLPCQQECMDRCFTNKINRIPFGNLINDFSTDQRYLSYFDLKNETIYKLYIKCKEKCDENCNQNCYYNFTKTYISSPFRSELQLNLQWIYHFIQIPIQLRNQLKHCMIYITKHFVRFHFG